MGIEKGPSGQNSVEDAELAEEMASIENSSREWAKYLADAIKNPEKFEISNLPPWLQDEIFTYIDLNNLKRMGVTPEDIISYGEESAESVEHLAEYAENLDGMTKMQLLKEYFKQFAEGLSNKMKSTKAYDENRQTVLTKAPEMVTQPKEYQNARRAYEETVEKRALIWNKMK